MVHKCKCWPEFYRHIEDGSKTWDARIDDRGYLEGHFIEENEWDPTPVVSSEETIGEHEVERKWDHKGYTGRSLLVKIGYIGRCLPGFPHECVVMSIEVVQPGWWKRRPNDPLHIERRKHLDVIGGAGGKASLETQQ